MDRAKYVFATPWWRVAIVACAIVWLIGFTAWSFADAASRDVLGLISVIPMFGVVAMGLVRSAQYDRRMRASGKPPLP